MSELRVSADWSYRGLRVVSLENRTLRLVILPEAGAKIWQITYKPLDLDLLWNNPRVLPQAQPMNSRYDDVWSGGWDELFPNDEVAVIDGEPYPDHGELWTGNWDAETFSSAEEVGVKLRFATPISSIEVEKRIVLRRNDSRICFQHQFTNCGRSAFPFLWKLHPAFRATAKHRVDFPPSRVVLDPAFPGTLSGAPAEFDWPKAHIDGHEIDLRRVPCASERQLYFFYNTGLKEGWCALTDTEHGVSCGLQFDPSIFRCCWLFASYGGWRNHNVAVLEPCTGYPLNFEAMQAAGRHRTLAPGESLSTSVLFSVQSGIREVGSVAADGTILPA
jgi:galactose mutarotase-like enzyme